MKVWRNWKFWVWGFFRDPFFSFQAGAGEFLLFDRLFDNRPASIWRVILFFVSWCLLYYFLFEGTYKKFLKFWQPTENRISNCTYLPTPVTSNFLWHKISGSRIGSGRRLCWLKSRPLTWFLKNEICFFSNIK